MGANKNIKNITQSLKDHEILQKKYDRAIEKDQTIVLDAKPVLTWMFARYDNKKKNQPTIA